MRLFAWVLGARRYLLSDETRERLAEYWSRVVPPGCC